MGAAANYAAVARSAARPSVVFCFGARIYEHTSRLLPTKSSAGILPASSTDAGWKPALLGTPKQKTMAVPPPRECVRRTVQWNLDVIRFTFHNPLAWVQSRLNDPTRR